MGRGKLVLKFNGNVGACVYLILLCTAWQTIRRQLPADRQLVLIITGFNSRPSSDICRSNPQCQERYLIPFYLRIP